MNKKHKAKSEVTIWPNHSTPIYKPKRIKNLFTHSYKQMFPAALLLTAMMLKQPKNSSADEWLNNMWPIHTKERYSAGKISEVLMHAAIWIWVDVEHTMLSERSQILHDLIYMKCTEQANQQRKKVVDGQ